MKFDINIWRDRRDLNDKPTSYLIDLLAESLVYSTLLGAAAGACFALAWSGGTENTRAWQWVVFGSMTVFGVAVGTLGNYQLSSLIKKRIEKPDDGSSQQASAP